jgi:hypothetical protein
MAKPTLQTICAIAATVRCLNAGQSINQVAASAKVSPQKVRGWLKVGGFKRVTGTTKYLFGY